MEDVIVAIVLLLVALLMFIVGVRSFLEKGYLFNNAYIYASKKERESMNKKPYYRQSGMVFIFIGVVFLLLGIAILFDMGWLSYVSGAVILLLLIYAIVSAVAIEKGNKRE